MRHGTGCHGRVLQGCLILALSGAGAGAVCAEEIITTLDDQQEIALTVYNSDLALVRDVRKVPLAKGLNTIAVREVSAQIHPETTIITNVSHPDSLSLLEQNFDYDLLTPGQLLQKYVGKQIKVVKTHPTTGAEKEVAATVLSANDGVVLRIGDRIETGAPGRIVYESVPDNLRDRPTLSILARSSRGGKQTLELSYLTDGLGWRADYVAKLDKDDAHVDMNGWVTLHNQSGVSYKNSKLQLVAGDLNLVSRNDDFSERAQMVRAMRDRSSVMEEEGLFEYHLYTLGHKTDVLQNQTKQVSLMTASRIPVTKKFLLRGQRRYYRERYDGEKLKVGVFVEFDNTKEHGLGIALPRGIVRVYKNDSSGNAQFIGEDRIDHTPEDEKIRLKMGDAFDITAKKKQTEYKKGEHRTNSAYEIEIHNAKEEDVTVRVSEPIPGDWTMIESSIPHEKPDAHTAEWKIMVPAKQRVTLTYSVSVRYSP